MSTAGKDFPVKTDMGRKLTLLALRIITVVMVFFFGVGSLYTFQRFSPGAQEQFLPILLAAFSVEAILTHIRTKILEGREKTLFRISELVTIAVLLKAFLLFQNKGLVLTAELSAWQNDFLMSFFDARFLFHLILVFSIWAVTTYLMDLYDQLHDRELDATWEDIGKLSNSLKTIRNKMITVQVTMLILLIFNTALASVAIEIPDLLSFKASSENPAWVVMVFTVLLMTQFSLTQFILLRSRWELDRAVMTRAVPRQWLMYGMVFLVFIGILAVFLPTRYSISFFELLAGLMSIISQIAGFLLYILTLPFILLMRLFSGQETPVANLPPVSLPQVNDNPNSPVHLPPIFEILRAIVFWAAFIGIVGFAFYQIISANKEIWKTLMSFAVFRWISSILQQIKEFFTKAGQSLQTQMRKIQLAGLRGPSVRLPGFRQTATPKDPRARIIVLYKNLVDYAGNRGIRRKEHLTPYQYEEQLEDNLPDVTGEVSDVTEGFVTARYSAHDLTEMTADRLTYESTRIKKSLDDRSKK